MKRLSTVFHLLEQFLKFMFPDFFAALFDYTSHRCSLSFLIFEIL